MFPSLDLTQSFQSQGWTIKYGVFGEPHSPDIQTIVFVHGTPWSSTVFKPLASALLPQRRYRVVLYDLAGYGLSQTHEDDDKADLTDASNFVGDTSVATQALILSNLCTHLSLSNPAIIAHDIGGPISLRAHLLHSLRPTSLLLLDANAVLPWGDTFYTLVRAHPQPFLSLPLPIFAAMLRAVVRSASTGLSREWEDELVRPWEGEKGRYAFVRQVAQARDGDVREMEEGGLYGGVGCRVRILWGEEDAWVPGEKVERLGGLIGGGTEVRRVEGAGHLVMVDRGERVGVEVGEWLGMKG